jgi:hypothetical protein
MVYAHAHTTFLSRDTSLATQPVEKLDSVKFGDLAAVVVVDDDDV